jgi:FdhD protein
MTDQLPDPHAPTGEYQVSKWKAGAVKRESDCLAEEVPVALVYNGVSHAVMLATPQDLEDFALGFSLTEGILQSKRELYGLDVVEQSEGISLQMEIATERFEQLKHYRRSMAGRTGCGLCGAENLEQAVRMPKLSKRLIGTPLNRLPWQSIQRAFEEIGFGQVLQQATGATHACAWADEKGQVMLVREDVGRHNALDKLIGVLAKQPPSDAGFILTTSRASFEMVKKSVSVGVNLLAAISAPTGLAVRIAEAEGMTLVGFVRAGQHVVYAHPEKVCYE